MGEDDPSAEPDSSCDNERVYGHLAARADRREEMAGKAGNAHAGRNHPRIAPTQFQIDRFVGSTTSIELK